MTPETKATVEFLCKQRSYMKDRVAEYESGKWKIGRIEAGVQVDETQSTIQDLRRRIVDLDRVIAAYKKPK